MACLPPTNWVSPGFGQQRQIVSRPWLPSRLPSSPESQPFLQAAVSRDLLSEGGRKAQGHMVLTHQRVAQARPSKPAGACPMPAA